MERPITLTSSELEWLIGTYRKQRSWTAEGLFRLVALQERNQSMGSMNQHRASEEWCNTKRLIDWRLPTLENVLFQFTAGHDTGGINATNDDVANISMFERSNQTNREGQCPIICVATTHCFRSIKNGNEKHRRSSPSIESRRSADSLSSRFSSPFSSARSAIGTSEASRCDSHWSIDLNRDVVRYRMGSSLSTVRRSIRRNLGDLMKAFGINHAAPFLFLRVAVSFTTITVVFSKITQERNISWYRRDSLPKIYWQKKSVTWL